MEEVETARRKALQASVGALCVESGYISIEKEALAVLTEILQSYITEVGRTARVYCELASRTEPTATDVQLALLDSGVVDAKSLPDYSKRLQRRHLPRQLRNHPQPQPRCLQVGTKPQRPSHIPPYLPSLPDPHTYIRTPTFVPPTIDYKTVRGKMATQKRNARKGLSKLLAKTHPSQSIAGESDPYGLYTVSSCPTPTAPLYLQALMPTPEDQIDTVASEKLTNEENTSAEIDQSDSQEGNLNLKDSSAGDASGGPKDVQDTSETYENPFLKPAKRIKKPTSLAMAIARDPLLEQLHRTVSATVSLDSTSSLSLDRQDIADIDAVVNRRWKLDEVIVLLQLKLAILSGGRDKRGGPMITVASNDHTDFRPINVGRLLSYLAKVPDQSIQGLGFTIILDMRNTSWPVTKKALKSLQLTFVEHIFQVFVIKPKAFWQRQKTGMNFQLKKSRFNFPVIMLENSTDIFHHLQVSQITKDLGGTLPYDHEEWIDTQRSLETHLLGLLGRLDDFERLREQLDQPEHADNLNEARDSVRRHVEAKQQLDKADLDCACDAVSHTISKLQPCSNLDFTACFTRLEELCSGLQTMRDRLETVWEEKGGRLDQILQLRVYENDSDQLLQWVRDEGISLAHEHTDIGDSVTTAELRKQSFDNFRTRMTTKYLEVSRVLQMGERLVTAYHYASDMIRGKNIELRCTWEVFSSMVDDRSALLALSVVFHDGQQKFFNHVEEWVDGCMVKEYPSGIPQAEDLLQAHIKLHETYQEMYSMVRRDGHKMIEKLRRPVGESSLPANFIIGTRNVKEILEGLYDEKTWVDEQWGRRNTILRQALNLRRFQEEARKVHSWISEVGNPFLALGSTIGEDTGGTQWLLKKHDNFEAETERIYGLSSQLFSKAKALSDSGDCNKDKIEEEVATLEDAVHTFAARLDERREIIVQAFEYYQKAEMLSSELRQLRRPIPQEKFDGDIGKIELQLQDFQTRRSKVDKIAMDAFGQCEGLISRLNNASRPVKGARNPVNYSTAIATTTEKLEELKKDKREVDESCDGKENRWNLTIQLDQVQKDVQKHLDQQDSWTSEQARTEWEPAENIMDAQLKLDAFERQYNQFQSTHNELVTRGQSIAKQMDQSDSLMFGSGRTGPTHPAVVCVEGVVGKLESSLSTMDRTAGPKLRLLMDCMQSHLLQQRANKLTAALFTLSSAASHITTLGHSLETAQLLWQQGTEANKKLQAVCQDVESFSNEVKGCVERGHYDSVILSRLAQGVGKRRMAVNKAMSEKLKIVKTSVEFHQNIDKLFTAIENCQKQFGSKDVGTAVSDTQRLLVTLEELRNSVEQAAEEVQDQGKKLLEIMASIGLSSKANKQEAGSDQTSLGPSRPRKRSGSDADILTDQTSAIDLHRKRRDNYDVLDSATKISTISESMDVAEDCADSPKPLVMPKKACLLKNCVSLPSGKASNTPQSQVIESLLHNMEVRLQRMHQHWLGRKNRLEQAQKVIGFSDAVPPVLEWVDTVGTGYLSTKHHYGRSIEEVELLMKQYYDFEQTEMKPIAERAESLIATYRIIEESGHHHLNEIRALASSLEQKWGKFERDMKDRIDNLGLSLNFQKTLFQASNWCQKSQQFLSPMELKIESCDTSSEAASLSAELSVYLSATRAEQSERVSQVQQISTFLHSNVLVELANQIEQSTMRTVREFEQCQLDVEKLHIKLVQIESEKNRERRLNKQRERVLEELLLTEEVYVNDLRLVVEKCRPRFVSDMMPKSLRGKETVIFSNIHEIQKFHKGYLLPKLKQHPNDVDGIAQVFTDCADEMASVYVPFCMKKSASEELLASHRTYLSRVQVMLGTDVPLSSLLIKPIQRITKYPLLLKDALKYTLQLGQDTSTLEDALKAVEKIPVETNNAIHLSLLEGFEEPVTNLGKLLYQGLLHVSEPKFGIKAGKERQVFAFETVLLFSRKLDSGQANFRYEFKFKLPISSDQKLTEFFEGDPCKFCLVTGDHRIHLKSNTLDLKQDWVKALRTAILQSPGKNKVKTERHDKSLLSVDSWVKDLRVPSPSVSPEARRKMNGAVVGHETPPPLPAFDRYQVTEDYTSGGDHSFSLVKGDIVEILDNNIVGKWFVRSVESTMDHGWIPSSLLEKLEGEDEVDIGGKGKKKNWVQITAGPLNSSSDEEKWKMLKQQASLTAFGSHDLHSQQVISNLKKVTFGIGPQEPIDEDTLTSLDKPGRPARQDGASRIQVSTLDRVSPRQSPRGKRRHTDVGDVSRVRFERTENGEGNENGGRSDWTKSRWRRHAVIRRRVGRSGSVTSEGTDRSESPSEKMLSNGSDDELLNGVADTEDTTTSAEVSEEDTQRMKRAEEKLKYIMTELLETEREYVNKLEECVNGYMKEMQSPNLPDALKGKEKLIFSNIQSVYEFHHGKFFHLLEEANHSLEDTAKCFLDQAHQFEVYVTYCENKPKSESFLWTYQHTGGTFFEEIQNQLGHREGIASFLIKPVQRITKYQLLLRDLHKSAQKAAMETPNLEKALQLMQDVPKRANDAMALSMIYGYDGNIHSYGQIILQDEFTVYERSRWIGAHRHIFLLEQRLIITKEKDADGLYVYKDSLKVHSLFLAEKQADNPSRFAVGTGPIADSEQYYVLEASSVEKKQQWVQAIKDILQQQFQLLKALKQPNTLSRIRSETVDTALLSQSVAMINLSDDSEDEFSPGSNPSSPWMTKGHRNRAKSLGEPTPSTPPLKSTRVLNLYIVAEDCAPPKQDEGILFIHKGEVYDVIDDSSDWWFAHLARDPNPDSDRIGLQGWVSGSFLERFTGELSYEEEATLNSPSVNVNRNRLLRQSAVGPPKHVSKSKSPRNSWSKSMVFTTSATFEESDDEEEDMFVPNPASPPLRKGEAPRIISHLSNETVIAGRCVQFRCQITNVVPTPCVEWSHDGASVNIDRAFTTIGEESCVLRIKQAERSDEGMYMCTVKNELGIGTSIAQLTVLSPPDPPSKPLVRPLTSTSVRLSWESPRVTGHSPITIYLIECKDTLSDRWSTLMKRIHEPSAVVDELMPGTHYIFRVIAGNHIGSSEPSEESDDVRMVRSPLDTQFSMEPFDGHYELLDEIGRGRFSAVYECLHRPTQQMYAAKLLPKEIGQERAQQEMDMLSQLSHRNIVQMTSGYLTQTHFVILFQLIEGTNILEYFSYGDCLTESAAALCIEQVLSALQYLHESNIAHLDIKPMNILAVKQEDTVVPVIKLIHFERARRIEPNSSLVVGRLEEHIEYEAPEILIGEPVTLATDMWSLGVVLYTLLGGCSPFLVDSLDLTKDNIKNVRYTFPIKCFREISENATDLIAKMLVKDKSNRISATQCLRHQWLQETETTKTSQKLNTAQLNSYLSSQKWQSALVSTTNQKTYK